MDATSIAALAVSCPVVVAAALAVTAPRRGPRGRRPSRGASEGERGTVDRQLAVMVSELRGLGELVRRADRDRHAAHADLHAQLRALDDAQRSLRLETANLVTALRNPVTRGRWGELQLRRVVELAGMVPHCDFVEQATRDGGDARVRPDLLVRLPGGKLVVVDAKVPLERYLEAIQAGTDDARARVALVGHARQVRAHVDALAAKSYWEQFPESPDFVVMFVPGDPLLAAALEHDPALLEDAIARGVHLATPTTLISLLRSAAYGWQQAALAENAARIAVLGRQLQERLTTFTGHVARVGRSLDGAIVAYNEAVGSLESRVLVTARRLAALEVGEAPLEAPAPVERRARPVGDPDLERSRARGTAPGVDVRAG